MSFLSLAIWLPILAGVVLLALGRDDNARAVALVRADRAPSRRSWSRSR